MRNALVDIHGIVNSEFGCYCNIVPSKRVPSQRKHKSIVLDVFV